MKAPSRMNHKRKDRSWEYLGWGTDARNRQLIHGVRSDMSGLGYGLFMRQNPGETCDDLRKRFDTFLLPQCTCMEHSLGKATLSKKSRKGFMTLVYNLPKCQVDHGIVRGER